VTDNPLTQVVLKIEKEKKRKKKKKEK